jgi:chemotaxis protein MotB
VLAFLLHAAALLLLWKNFPSVSPAQEVLSIPVTEVELAPSLDSTPATSESETSPQQELQDFQASALARAESLEHTLSRAIAQQATTEAARQQQLDTLTAAQVTLRGQVTSLADERAELTAQLDSERQRAEALAQQVQEIQQAREKELQGLKGTYDHLVAALQSEISQKDIALHQAKEQLTVTILDRVLFPSGQATLSPEGEQVIEKVGTVLAKVAGQQILIEGHTDDVPIGPVLKARFPSNWELSSARAAEVVKYLLSHAQLSPQQLSAVGRAETSPVASNANEEGRRLNRRIEIIVLPSDQRTQRGS